MAEQVKEWHTLQQEKNKMLQSNSAEYQSKITDLTEEVQKLEKSIGDKSQVLKETDEQLKTVQFENDELSIKLEKYEGAMKEHQVVLTDNECFIEQLNQEVGRLKEQLKRYEDEEKIKVVENVKEIPKDESVKLKEDLTKAEGKVQEYGEKIERLEKQMHCYESMQERTPVARTPAAKIKLQSLSRTPDFNAPPSPFKQTPIKKLNNTPKASPYSPAKVSHQQTIKKLERLLDETAKALEKKTAMVVTKTNRVQHLESQVTSLEKKTAVKELRAEKTGLENKVSELEEEVVELMKKKEEFKFKLANEEENSASVREELERVTTKCDELEGKLNTVIAEKEFSEKRHENDMQHNQVLLNQAFEKGELSARKISELGEQVNKTSEVIEDLTKSLNKEQLEKTKTENKLVEVRALFEAKIAELKEANTKMIQDERKIKVRARIKQFPLKGSNTRIKWFSLYPVGKIAKKAV